MKSFSLEKPIFPLTSKVVALLWTLIVASKRLMVIVMYFAPVFGLFDLLNLFKWEQIQFVHRNDVNISSVLAKVDRWNYEDPSNPVPPHYTLYTGYDIGHYFSLFWLILFFHTYLNILVKCMFSKKFRDEATNLEIFVHAFENSNFPTPWKDWDERRGNVKEHLKRFRRVRSEMLGTMFVNFSMSCLMLMPFCYTGKTEHFNIVHMHEIRLYNAHDKCTKCTKLDNIKKCKRCLPAFM